MTWSVLNKVAQKNASRKKNNFDKSNFLSCTNEYEYFDLIALFLDKQ